MYQGRPFPANPEPTQLLTAVLQGGLAPALATDVGAAFLGVMR